MMKLIYVPLSWLVVGGIAAYQLLTTGRIDQTRITDWTIGIGNKMRAWADRRLAD